MNALNIVSVLSPVRPAEVKLLSFRRKSMRTCLETLTFIHTGLYDGKIIWFWYSVQWCKSDFFYLDLIQTVVELLIKK